MAREEAAAAKEGELASREETVASLEHELQMRSETLQQRARALGEREAVVSGAADAIASEAAAFAVARESVLREAALLSSRSADTAAWEKVLASRASDVAQREEDLCARETAMEAFGAVLSEQALEGKGRQVGSMSGMLTSLACLYPFNGLSSSLLPHSGRVYAGDVRSRVGRAGTARGRRCCGRSGPHPA